MKLAVIAPPQCFKVLEAIKQDYHLCLAQRLVDDLAYLEWHEKLDKKNHFVIVDNGAAEGEMFDFDQVVGWAKRIGAAEVVMPDVLKRASDTLHMWMSTAPWELLEPKMRMIVPQGNGWAEWIDCAEKMYDIMRREGGFTSWGLPKHLERLSGGRAWAVGWLKSRGLLDDHEVHMLGAWGSPVNEIYAATTIYKDIRGIDTGAPIAYAARGLIIDGPERASLDWNVDLNNEGMKTAVKNAQLIQGVCNAGSESQTS